MFQRFLLYTGMAAHALFLSACATQQNARVPSPRSTVKAFFAAMEAEDRAALGGRWGSNGVGKANGRPTIATSARAGIVAGQR